HRGAGAAHRRRRGDRGGRDLPLPPDPLVGGHDMSAELVLRRLQLDPSKVDRGTDAARREGIPLARWLVDSGWLAGDVWAREAAAELGLEDRKSTRLNSSH